MFLYFVKILSVLLTITFVSQQSIYNYQAIQDHAWVKLIFIL